MALEMVLENMSASVEGGGIAGGISSRHSRRPIRRIRTASILAIVFGILGILLGVLGVVTFIPLQGTTTYSPHWSVALTVVASIGAIVSVLEVFGGWEMRRARPWAWNATLGATVASVASVGAMTALWPESWGFLAVVVVCYAIEALFLLAGRRSYRAAVPEMRFGARGHPGTNR